MVEETFDVVRDYMKTYTLKDRKTGSLIYISEQHYGYDPQIEKIRLHGIYCPEGIITNNAKEILERLDTNHGGCKRLPQPARFREDLYELVTEMVELENTSPRDDG